MQLYIAIACGFILSFLFNNQEIVATVQYFFEIYKEIIFTFLLQVSMYGALAVGLYGSTSGIYLHELHKHRNLIIRAVTLGVLLKSIIIGSALWLIFHTPYAFLFGIIVAQIDPLAVAYLSKKKPEEFSPAGRTILQAWSSFDDPMTVLLALYVFLPLVISTNSFSLFDYLLQFGLNLLFAFVIYLLQRYVLKSNGQQLVLLALAFLIAVPFKLVLGIALIGLFLRPQFKMLYTLVRLAFLGAAFLLGTLLQFTNISVLYGLVLGVIAYFAQSIAAICVAPHVGRKDKIFLAFSQHNGITAIVLALIIAQWVPETVGVIAVAIIVINTLYYGVNYILERKLK